MLLALLGCAATNPNRPEAPTTTPTQATGEAAVAIVQRPASFAIDGDQWSLTTDDAIFDAAIAFYADHGDDYDFLIFYTEAQIAGLFAYSVPLDHGIEGIGQQEVMALYGWDDFSPAMAGSAGRLQAVCMMNAASVYPEGGFYSPQDILTHEVTHRWGANLSIDAVDPWALVDGYWSHWNVHAAVGGPSALGYGELVDEGDRFSFTRVVPLANSDLELYQMGLLAADEVGPLFWVEDPSDYTPATPPDGRWDNDDYGADASFAGTRRDLTMDDVIARHGARVPDAADAQTAFRMAFVLLCDGDCDPDALAFAEEQRALWPDTWSTATRGLALADTTLAGG